MHCQAKLAMIAMGGSKDAVFITVTLVVSSVDTFVYQARFMPTHHNPAMPSSTLCFAVLCCSAAGLQNCTDLCHASVLYAQECESPVQKRDIGY